MLLTHRENHFDWKALITAAVQPVVNLEIQTYVPPIADNVLQQVVLTFTDDIISSSIATHVLNRESLEYAAADALGSATGNLIHQKLVELYQTLQTKLEYSAYQSWVKQQANLAERIQELKEKQAALDEELKKIEAKNKAFTNNTDTSNKNKRNHTEDNNSNTKKNPSYEKRTQDHEETTSRARRWSQAQNQPTFWQKLEKVYDEMDAFSEGENSSVYGNSDVNINNLPPGQLSNLEDFKNYIKEYLLPIGLDLDTKLSDYRHLLYSRCVVNINYYQSILNIFFHNYLGIFCKEFSLQDFRKIGIDEKFESILLTKNLETSLFKFKFLNEKDLKS